MYISSRNLFSEDQLAQINQAVQEAESETSGEIVPVLATFADTYDRGLFYAAMMFSTLAIMLVVAFYFLPLDFLAHDPWKWKMYLSQSENMECEYRRYVTMVAPYTLGMGGLRCREVFVENVEELVVRQ